MVERRRVITGPTSSRVFFSPSLQRKIVLREWCGDKCGGKLVLLLHGLGDHSLRHNWAASLLAGAGYRVAGIDWPGNGESDGIRGDMPAVPEAGPFLEEVVGELGQSPAGVYAHSTGAFLFLHWLGASPRCLDALEWVWFSSPLLLPSHRQGKLKILVARRLAGYLPRMTLSTGVRTRDCFHTGFDPSVEAAFRKDGGHHRVSLRFATSLLEYEQRLGPIVDGLREELAFLVSQGSEDEICPPVYAEELFARLPVREKCFLLVSGARHEPFREPFHVGITNAVRSWLGKRENNGNRPLGLSG